MQRPLEAEAIDGRPGVKQAILEVAPAHQPWVGLAGVPADQQGRQIVFQLAVQLQPLGFRQGLRGVCSVAHAQSLLPAAQGDHTQLQLAAAAQLLQSRAIHCSGEPGQGQGPGLFAGCQPQRLPRLRCAAAQQQLISCVPLPQPGREQVQV